MSHLRRAGQVVSVRRKIVIYFDVRIFRYAPGKQEYAVLMFGPSVTKRAKISDHRFLLSSFLIRIKSFCMRHCYITIAIATTSSKKLISLSSSTPSARSDILTVRNAASSDSRVPSRSKVPDRYVRYRMEDSFGLVLHRSQGISRISTMII